MLQKRVNLVDLVKSCQIRFQYLLAKIGFDTAENGPLKVCQQFAKRSKKVNQNKHRLDGLDQDLANATSGGADNATSFALFTSGKESARSSLRAAACGRDAQLPAC